MSGLSGKIALVTGASRGIGQAIAKRLAGDGAIVAVHYNTGAEAAEATVTEIVANGGTASTIKADLSARDGARGLAQSLRAELTSRFGSPSFDILVNNAGVAKRATIEEISEDDFDLVLQTNLKSRSS